MRARKAAALVCILALWCPKAGAVQAPNPPVDVAVLRQAAERGDLAAMFRLGGAYRDGSGVPQDFVTAHAWLSGAAMLATGADAKPYMEAAQQLARRMSEAQLDDAEKRAFDGLQRVAAAGHPGAQYVVGMTYYAGPHRVAPQDFARAAEWLRKAANQGDRKAQSIVANMYLNGEGVSRDEAQAFHWWTKSAAQGLPDAQYLLGLSYANGNGVTADQAKALEWFRRAADQGDVRAEFRLGVAYAYGLGAVQDYALALPLIRKSSERGYADAQFELGVMHEYGRGVPEDKLQAAKWYGLAAEQGDPLAQYNLGRFFAYGKGIPQDHVEAYKWASLAAARAPARHQKAFAEARDQFAQAMTPEQIGEAQKRARVWLDAFEKRR